MLWGRRIPWNTLFCSSVKGAHRRCCCCSKRLIDGLASFFWNPPAPPWIWLCSGSDCTYCTSKIPEGIHKFPVPLLLHMLDTSYTGCIIRVLPPIFSVGGRTLSCILNEECEWESCENSTLWSTSSATDHPSQLPSLTYWGPLCLFRSGNVIPHPLQHVSQYAGLDGK